MKSGRQTTIRGARMHNLRGINCRIPLRKITVITGVSGSGKSTLAYDILYAEGQRRFVECLSAYARQFMERLERPDVEHIGYIQPPIALKQRVSIKNARSTVGSITELTDHIRLLFVHAGEAHCRECGGSVVHTGTEEAVEAIRRWPPDTPLAIIGPLPGRPDATQLERLRRDGYSRILLNGKITEIDDLPLNDDGTRGPTAGRARAGRRRSGKTQGGTRRGVVRHGVVVDRIVVGKTRRNRLAEAVTAAWQCGDGVCQIRALDPAAARAPRHMILRQGFTCSNCGARAAPPTPALFSWNSPLGACPDCQGFGRIVKIDRDKVVPDPRKNLKNHAVVPFSVPSTRGWYRQLLRQARAREIRTDVPFGKLAPHEQDWVFHGDEEFSGVEGLFKDLERKRYKMHVRIFISRFRGYVPCPRCGGSRLRPEALAFSVAGKTIQEIHEMPLDDLRTFFEEIDLPGGQHAKIRTLLESTRDRMDCLADLGVGYLTLARSGRTLSGGETQRIRIAAALGSSLTDTLFILDEPTVGLHATDTAAMVAALERLSRTGNTVVVVEHDPKVIESADHLIVLGPGGGREGGRLIYEGPPEAFLTKEPGFFVGHLPPENAPHIGGLRRGVGTLARERGTARRGRKKATRRGRLGKPWDPDEVQRWLEKRAAPRATPAAGSGGALVGLRLQLKEAREHNLQIPSLEIPLSGLTVITGVSGSGKSTLLDEIVHRNWLRFRGRPVEDVGEVARIDGLDAIDEAHLVGQNPLGRSSRSNPISFVKAYAEIRKLLGSTLLARQKGLGAGAFSFNVTAGRCEACRGMGTQVLDMYFLPDIEASCEVCGGKRFRPEVLEVKWQGKNIHDILQMTVDEATVFFQREGRIVERLAPLRDVGLGYIILGQSTATLSTGEAQRLRLGSFLAGGNDDERHLFLFDEPTTGLHARDVGRLLRALRALVARGHGVIAVEHQLDFIRSADWVVDLGPGPGAAGGQVVYAGPVGGLLIHRTSVTAEALREHIERVAAWQ